MSNQDLWWCHKCGQRMPKDHAHSILEELRAKHKAKMREERRKKREEAAKRKRR